MTEKEKAIEAFFILFVLPLGGEGDEYLEQKKYLFLSLEAIARVGNLLPEMEAAFEKYKGMLETTAKDPAFQAFAKSFEEKKSQS